MRGLSAAAAIVLTSRRGTCSGQGGDVTSGHGGDRRMREHAVLRLRRKALWLETMPTAYWSFNPEAGAESEDRGGHPAGGSAVAASAETPSIESLAFNTPSRASVLGRMVANGVISRDVAINMIADGRVTERGWRAIKGGAFPKGVSPGARPHATEILTRQEGSYECWTADLLGAHDARELSLTPILSVEHALDAAVGLLEELARDGWRLQHVSEDRGITEHADKSFVIEARCLLEREVP